MRKVLLTGAALGLLAGVGTAVAQTPTPPLPAPGAQDGQGRPPFPGPGPGPGPMEHEHGGPGRGPFRIMRMMEMMSKGAQFHLRRGENRLDIKCAADEPMKACVDAASALLDKVNSLPRSP